MKKHIIHIILAVEIISTAFEGMWQAGYASSAGIFNGHWVSLKGLEQQYGNIYYGNEMPQFIFSIENPDDIAYDIDMSCIVKDEFGSIGWSQQESFCLNAKTHIVKAIVPSIQKYGIYTLTVTLAGSFGEIALSEDFSRAAQPDGVDEWLGIQFNIDDLYWKESSEINTRLAKRAGFGTIRDDMRWGNVETEIKETDKYKVPGNRADDIELALADGMQQILILGDSNELYEDGKMPASADGIRAYADFCAYIASKYIGQNVVYEISNEPDYEKFTGWDATGADYAKLLVAAYDAIKNVDENAKVVSAGICSLSGTHAQGFFEEMLSVSNITQYMDAFSFHPYNDNGVLSDEQKSESPDLKTGKTFLEQIEYAKEKLDAKTLSAQKTLPIWITEYGVSSRNDSADWSYTEREQASDLVRTITAAKSEDRVEKFIVYNLREVGDDSAAQQHNYGIVDSGYNAKPSYLAIAQMNRMLYGAEYNRRYTDIGYTGERAYSAYEFKKNTEEIYILWEHTGKIATVRTVNDSTVSETELEDEGSNAVIHLPDGFFAEYYDMYGNLIDAANGAYCALSGEPVYVVCKKEQASTTVERSGNIVTVRGQAKEPFEEVTLVAADASADRKLLNINQVMADDKGSFEFSFAVPDSEPQMWSIYIFNGIEKELAAQYGMGGFGLTTEYFINGVLVDSLDEIQSGDEVSVKLTVDSRSTSRPTFAGVIYNKYGALTALDAAAWLESDDMATAEVKLKVENDADLSAIKYFIWDKDQKPVAKPITISY